MQNANKVKFALKSAYFAPITIAEDGTISYGTPKREKGAISLSLSTTGKTQTLKADAIDYYVGASNDGYEGDLEMAIISDEFKCDYLGETQDKNGLQFENLNDEVKPFAFLFEFMGDKKNTRHCLFHCYASKPAIEGENPDNAKTPKTEKVSIKAIPREADDMVKCSTTAETSQSAYDAFFDAVPEFTAKSE